MRRRWADLSPEDQAHERSEYEGRYGDTSPCDDVNHTAWHGCPTCLGWDMTYDPDDHTRAGTDAYTDNLRGGY